jgi:hypothetical protein
MTHAREMLDTHPGTTAMDADALIECIEACFDCSDMCATTGRIVSRQTEFEPAMARATLQACAEACSLCAEECETHAKEMNMEHCRVCAEACRRCERACNEALSAVGA